MTTIGYVAGSLSQASLKVSSAAGFFGAVARLRAGAKVLRRTAFSAARRSTDAAASDILRTRGLASRCFSAAQRARGALRRLDFSSKPKK